METKSVMKSVRLTPRTAQAISEYRGDGFNDSLANLVDDYLHKHDELVRDWEMLQAAITDKRLELRAIQRRVQQARDVDQRLTPLINAVLALLPSE